MKVFVTGSMGLLGGHIVPALEAAGHTVVGYDKKANPADDVHDTERTTGRMKGCDAVIHLAAIPHPTGQPRSDFIALNIDGTVSALNAALAAGIVRFVYCSTGATYGFNEGLDTKEGALTEEDSVPPERAWTAGDYQGSKILAEQEVKARAARFRSGALALRIDGPGEANQGGVHRGWQCPWEMLEEAFVRAVAALPEEKFVAVNVGCADPGAVDFSRMRTVLGMTND